MYVLYQKCRKTTVDIMKLRRRRVRRKEKMEKEQQHFDEVKSSLTSLIRLQCGNERACASCLAIFLVAAVKTNAHRSRTCVVLAFVYVWVASHTINRVLYRFNRFSLSSLASLLICYVLNHSIDFFRFTLLISLIFLSLWVNYTKTHMQFKQFLFTLFPLNDHFFTYHWYTMHWHIIALFAVTFLHFSLLLCYCCCTEMMYALQAMLHPL